MGGQRNGAPSPFSQYLNNALSNPLIGLSAGLLEAGSPSDRPQSLTSGLARGLGLASEMQRKNRFGGANPSGDIANALVIDYLRQTEGEDSPKYKMARDAFQSQLDARKSLMDYRSILGQTAPYRASSPLGKSIAEGQGRGALDMLTPGSSSQPGNVNAIDPQIQKAYEQDIAKKTTDTDARKRFLYAQNIDKTKSAIDIDALTQYSGINAQKDYFKDYALATIGKAPERFIKYNKALESSSLLADQVRQFYGDSIQPQAMQRLRTLTNPSTWYKNPEVARAQLKQFFSILDSETETYKKAGTSPIQLDRPFIDYKDGEFVAVRPETNVKEASTKNNASDENIDWDLDAVSSELIDTFPEATPENIRATAKKTGKSIKEVIDFLLEKKARLQGVQ